MPAEEQESQDNPLVARVREALQGAQTALDVLIEHYALIEKRCEIMCAAIEDLPVDFDDFINPDGDPEIKALFDVAPVEELRSQRIDAVFTATGDGTRGGGQAIPYLKMESQP